MVSEPRARIALGLPVDSGRRIAAATQVVIHLLRIADRVELSLLAAWEPGAPAITSLDAKPVLLVGADTKLVADTATARAALESDIRGRMERYYRGHGIASVNYDLQII